jgi:hypothetical protein
MKTALQSSVAVLAHRTAVENGGTWLLVFSDGVRSVFFFGEFRPRLRLQLRFSVFHFTYTH